MDKSSSWEIDLEEQRRAWNEWNSRMVGAKPTRPSLREWETIDQFIGALGRKDLEIIDVGCGAGWLSAQLLKYGRVTGTDLSDEVLCEAGKRLPSVRFVSGDFFKLDLKLGSYDIVATKDVLSHVPDQPTFVARMAELLRPGGHLIIATQNKPVLERWSAIPGPQPGQLRHWVDAKQMRALLRPHFDKFELRSVAPVGDQGFMRLINSYKLNRLAQMVWSETSIERLKERALLGHTLLAFAKKK